MTTYGSDDLKIEFDDSSGTLTNMSNYVMTFNGLDVQALLEESTAFGDSWVENLFTGIKQTGDITIGGMYDDTATTGPDVIFNSLGDTRTLKVTWGGTKTSSVETIIKDYKRLATVKSMTKYEVTVTPTGAVTEA